MLPRMQPTGSECGETETGLNPRPHTLKLPDQRSEKRPCPAKRGVSVVPDRKHTGQKVRRSRRRNAAQLALNLLLVAHNRHLRRPGGALNVQHPLVVRQRPVNLKRPRRSLPSVAHVVRHRNRQSDHHPWLGASRRLGRRIDTRDDVRLQRSTLTSAPPFSASSIPAPNEEKWTLPQASQ